MGEGSSDAMALNQIRDSLGLPRPDPIRVDLGQEHPVQPVIVDPHGVCRFKANAICRWIIDNGLVDMNKLAVQGFPNADREQFAQLIGYSVSGAGDLSYFSPEVLERAYANIDALRGGKKAGER